MRGLRTIIALGLAVSQAALDTARAGELCLRPEMPPMVQSDDDETMRDLIQEDYQRYFVEIADYLNCLEREASSAERESHEVIRLWQEQFLE